MKCSPPKEKKKHNKNNNKSRNRIQKNRHIHTERNKEVLRYASFDSCVLHSLAGYAAFLLRSHLFRTESCQLLSQERGSEARTISLCRVRWREEVEKKL